MKNKISISIVYFAVFSIICIAIYRLEKPEGNKLNANTGHAYIDMIETAQGEYIGEVISNIVDGDGKFIFLEGPIYEGEWQDALMHGQGHMVYEGVGEYEGYYRNNKRHGQGAFTWENGDIYEGQWIDDKMAGTGKYTFSGGSYITGEFDDNGITNGVFYYVSDSDLQINEENSVDTYVIEIIEFEATVINNIFSGNMKFTLSNGVTFDGEAEGFKSSGGSAEITYADGNKYSGELKDGKKSGEGHFYWVVNGEVVSSYDGSWADDMMNGDGRYYYTEEHYPYLKGKFVNGIPNGDCYYYKSIADIFKTTWNNGDCTKIEEYSHG